MLEHVYLQWRHPLRVMPFQGLPLFSVRDKALGAQNIGFFEVSGKNQVLIGVNSSQNGNYHFFR
jgi:hypothetical protein